MIPRITFLCFLCVNGAVAAAACSSEPANSTPETHVAGTTPTSPVAPAATAPDNSAAAAIDPKTLARFAPLRAPAGASAMADLGKTLFFEKRLSKSQKLSCNSCHGLSEYGVDHQRFSSGHDGQLGGRNAPSVYNAAGHVAQFWDGRAPTVEEQAKGPVLNPVEMAMPNAAAVEAVLRATPEYVAAFAIAFPGDGDAVTFDNMGKAIGAFERRLLTSSRWDQFLTGDTTALVPAEQRGLATFMKTGCASCHSGELLGAASYTKLGAARPWTRDNDRGRVVVTKDPKDERTFKVPSLRNIAQTAPYFHDGSVETLEETVRLMAQYQLDVDLSEDDVVSIATFLRSLTGALPSDLIVPPAPIPAPATTTDGGL